MNEFINTFHIDWKIMLAQLVNFGLVFFALYILAAKPLKKLIEERTKEIEGGLSDAKINKELKEKMQVEYDAMMVKARKDAQVYFEEAKKDTEKVRNESMEKIKIDGEQMIAQNKRSLEVEKIKMLDDAKKELASLVILATEKAIGEKNK